MIEIPESWSIICADNRPFLDGLPDGFADHVITDPPYDPITHKGAVTKSVTDHVLHGAAKGVVFDSLLDPGSYARSFVRIAKRWALAFCSVEQLKEYQAGSEPTYVRGGIWDKIAVAPQITGDRPGQAVEAIAIMHRKGRKRWNRGGCAGIWRHLPVTGKDRPNHPTPKPIGLMVKLIEDFTDPGDLILDPFCGSGATIVAAILTGRRAIGIEVNPEYAAIATDAAKAAILGMSARSYKAGQISLFGGGE